MRKGWDARISSTGANRARSDGGERSEGGDRYTLMPIDQLHSFVDLVAKILELVGAAIIIGGIALASWIFVSEGLGAGSWRDAYVRFRSNLGRGILLGLELLVGADIIATITAPLTFESVTLLGGVVLIRTFLSFSLETEIEGCWPWQRKALEMRDTGASEQR